MRVPKVALLSIKYAQNVAVGTSGRISVRSEQDCSLKKKAVCVFSFMFGWTHFFLFKTLHLLWASSKNRLRPPCLKCNNKQKSVSCICRPMSYAFPNESRSDPMGQLGNALSRMQLNSRSENLLEEKELEVGHHPPTWCRMSELLLVWLPLGIMVICHENSVTSDLSNWCTYHQGLVICKENSVTSVRLVDLWWS